MTPTYDTQRIIYGHTIAVARHFLAYKGSLEEIAEYIAFSIKSAKRAPAITDRQIAIFLRREETQETLASSYEVSLVQSIDKRFRLITLALPTDPKIAATRIAQKPASPGTQCRFCLIDEGGLAPFELKQEIGPDYNPVPGHYLHAGCEHAWKQLRQIAELKEDHHAE